MRLLIACQSVIAWVSLFLLTIIARRRAESKTKECSSSFSSTLQMQIETGISAKWAGRVPPLDLSAVTVCPRETECRWTSMQQHQQQRSPRKMLMKHHRQRMGHDGLPVDPREWTRSHVWMWLNNLAQSEGLPLTTELAQKFPMNGKALCLMSLDMYLSRVPVGGKMLYKDFRIRLARAMSL